ncbi:MAG: UDP-N-acetylmuramoyl-L-alanyl-D-glutamate--2,6-diaminopimelate ligase [Chloroflexi bacterium]|nr:UDP-N-acetylmuramoyl-L-alanyl-D-glutamate--2,6-diaminopimelate ligase [Chloroflexota bacterium]
MPKKFSEILHALPAGQLLSVSDETYITAPVSESDAEIHGGGIFVARKGLSVDGHEFIARALEKGAAAVVGESEISGLPVPYARVKDASEALGYLAAAFYDFPSRKLLVIGVTGTDGKTTTTTLIHSILQSANGTSGFISTIAADLGGQQVDTGLHVTTPSAPQVQALLAKMVENGLTHAVLEMTSHGLAQGRLNGVDLDVAVLTNITHEHLDYHGTWENYRAAKARMFEMLNTSARKGRQLKIAVINADDPSGDFFSAIRADWKALYSLRTPSEFQAQAVRYLPSGTYFEVDGKEFMTPLVGEFNVMNALAALTTASCLDVPTDAMRKGLAAVTAVSGRMERIDEGQNFTALVDFAHTPNALKNALEAARKMVLPGGRVIAVFGSAGLRDREKRRMMAEVAAKMADFTVLTAEDPRTESLETILQEMAAGCAAQGGVEGQTFVRVPDRGLALYEACRTARAGDLVVACGKGHEQSMCFGTIEYPWDDREALRAALRGTPLQTLPTARS